MPDCLRLPSHKDIKRDLRRLLRLRGDLPGSYWSFQPLTQQGRPDLCFFLPLLERLFLRNQRLERLPVPGQARPELRLRLHLRRGAAARRGQRLQRMLWRVAVLQHRRNSVRRNVRNGVPAGSLAVSVSRIMRLAERPIHQLNIFLPNKALRLFVSARLLPEQSRPELRLQLLLRERNNSF